MKGEIMIRARLSCGRCGANYLSLDTDEQPLITLPSVSRLGQWLKQDGWKKTKADGWICPDCASKRK